MQWKYCGFCANISIKREGNEWYCPKCEWRGIPSEGDMSEINMKAKSCVKGAKWTRPIEEYEEEKVEVETNSSTSSTISRPKAKQDPLQNHLGRPAVDNDEFKAKVVQRTSQGKVGSRQQELMERLKKKGGTMDYDFM